MENTFQLTIRTSGNFSESDLIDYIKFQLGGGGLSQDNAFVSEDSDAEINDVEVF